MFLFFWLAQITHPTDTRQSWRGFFSPLYTCPLSNQICTDWGSVCRCWRTPSAWLTRTRLSSTEISFSCSIYLSSTCAPTMHWLLTHPVCYRWDLTANRPLFPSSWSRLQHCLHSVRLVFFVVVKFVWRLTIKLLQGVASVSKLLKCHICVFWKVATHHYNNDMFAKKGCLKSTGNGVCVCVCLCLQIVRQKILFSVFYNTTPALQQDHHKPFFFYTKSNVP